ncbi:hypothetical protein [Klebsiella pneumoniae]|uniref:hypothetical protein n=1 Tax=Klebsiella pneumoniae TaxID=573 RepID=UPI0010F16BAE|nr:hypothetical protein [Klebsiella pneumoniae]VFZ85368.1 Uncharacterised protein [Klebsiella pneumoniae]
MIDITELALRLKLEVHRAVSNFNPQMNIKTRDLKALVEALEKAQQRIAELESRLNSADKLQDSAFRSGLQHGFSLGQTDDQKGYEQSMAAYSSHAGIKVEAE